MPTALEYRIGQREPRLRQGAQDRRHPMPALVERGVPRKERGCMAVPAEPQQRDLEEGSPRIESSLAIEGLELALVSECCGLGIVRLHGKGMNLVRWNRGMAQHRLPSHAIIAPGI